ncbi:MAG: segregation/condensation protein A [Patescibacteria group bacterium]
MFSVKLDQFAGPMQLLLELIEKDDLDITTVSLAKVTEDYTAYVNANDVPSSELADFLVVAAKLIYIKSRAILPLAPEEEEEADALAAQLKLYREFVDATVHVDELIKANHIAYGRPPSAFRQTATSAFRPAANVSGESLYSAFQHLSKRLEPFFALQQSSLERVASVEERIKQIHRVLLDRARMTFRDITKGAASKVDVVVSFLALLELMKQRLIKAVQHGAFDEIELHRID